MCALHFRGAPKCIVVDCDGTLWGGVVGEDGIHGIRLGETYPGVCYQQFQRQLRQLKEVGFLLALNSRNDEADVRAVFEQHPGMVLKYDDFSAVRVNWNDKAANMAAIAEELNLGTESLVFIDDNAFELERVRSAHPGIACLAVPRETWKLPELLPGMAVLDRLSLTAEDRAKSAMYARERQRDALRGRVVSFDDYLRQLDLRMTIEGFTPERHLDRAVQLLQKTNQFNLTTRRHSQREVLDLHEAGAMIHVASLADRFGDYGRIALSIIVVEAGNPRARHLPDELSRVGSKSGNRTDEFPETGASLVGLSGLSRPLHSFRPEWDVRRLPAETRISARRQSGPGPGSELSLPAAGTSGLRRGTLSSHH